MTMTIWLSAPAPLPTHCPQSSVIKDKRSEGFLRFMMAVGCLQGYEVKQQLISFENEIDTSVHLTRPNVPS